MKKILSSLGIIVVIGAVVAGATGAFYNDTEVSANNIFTAGAIDLKVDQRLVSYNGEECPTCHLKVVSDETNLVGSTPATVLTFIHPAWTADLDGGHNPLLNDGSTDGSKWIWSSQGPTQPSIDQTYTFDKTFVWNGSVASSTLYIATDNNYTVVTLNGNLVASSVDENNFQLATEDTYTVNPAFFVNGVNTLSITVKNWGSSPNPQSNPAGLLYKLVATGDCDANAYGTPGGYCQTWAETDLTDEQFFNYGDVKPGDWGRNLLSFHVTDNDAWMCLKAKNVVDDENVVVDPENPDSTPLGELDSNLDMFAWRDLNNNGVYEPGGTNNEPMLRHSFFDVFFDLPINDSTIGGPFAPNVTQYIGLGWCAGTWQGLPGTNPTCNGGTMPNNVQTDKLLADLEAYTEQWRNNPNFMCDPV